MAKSFKEFVRLKEAVAPVEGWEQDVSQDVGRRHDLKTLAAQQAAQKAAQQASNDRIFGQQHAHWQKQSDASSALDIDQQGREDMQRRQRWQQMQNAALKRQQQAAIDNAPVGSKLPSDYPADMYDRHMKKSMKRFMKR